MVLTLKKLFLCWFLSLLVGVSVKAQANQFSTSVFPVRVTSMHSLQSKKQRISISELG